MTQETISRAELDADRARQEATFTAQLHQLAAGLQDQITQLRTEMHQMRTELRAEMRQMRTEMHETETHQRAWRIYVVGAIFTGLIIGAMQIS